MLINVMLAKKHGQGRNLNLSILELL